jgi:hypothetical protein
LSAARRAKDYREYRISANRQLDISLVSTPPSGILFAVWENPEDEVKVAILKLKNEQGRKEQYLLTPEVAGLRHVTEHVRHATLVPIITPGSVIYVWCREEPDPAGNEMVCRHCDAMETLAGLARKRWVILSWDTGKPVVYTPQRPPGWPPKWPTGQSLEEMCELAIKRLLIDTVDHSVIERLKVEELWKGE